MARGDADRPIDPVCRRGRRRFGPRTRDGALVFDTLHPTTALPDGIDLTGEARASEPGAPQEETSHADA